MDNVHYIQLAGFVLTNYAHQAWYISHSAWFVHVKNCKNRICNGKGGWLKVHCVVLDKKCKFRIYLNIYNI